MACVEDFRESVEVQFVTNVDDGAGGYTESWQLRKSIFCMVEEVAGGESVIAGRLEHSEAFEITAHYDAEILLTDRVVMDGTEYKITRIDNIDRRNEYMTIYIETGRT